MQSPKYHRMEPSQPQAAERQSLQLHGRRSYSAKCSVVVNVPVTGIQFNDTSSSVGVGNETRLGYTITPPDATNKTVTWQSSDAAVA